MCNQFIQKVNLNNLEKGEKTKPLNEQSLKFTLWPNLHIEVFENLGIELLNEIKLIRQKMLYACPKNTCFKEENGAQALVSYIILLTV
jgi:hypothetical protein